MGTTIGVPDTGSVMTWHRNPNTSFTSASVITSLGDPCAKATGAHSDEVMAVARRVIEVV